jgi:hypothetical protein
MTAWEADARYQTLEDALEDLSVTFGWVLASLKGAAGLQNPDMATMVKLLKTANEAQRQRGVDLAVRLGKSALQELHELAGHGKRDVRNSCARALALIGDDSSIPILVAGLYGNSDKPTRFRPSTDTAAESLAQYPSEKRLAALRLIKNPIRQTQVQTILTGMQGNEAYEAVLDLRKRGLLLVDWSETDLQVLLAIDEERAWPEVRALLNGDNDFKIEHILPFLTPAKRLSLLTGWIERDSNYSMYYEDQMRFVVEAEADPETRIELLEKVRSNIMKHSGSFKKREHFLSRVKDLLNKVRQPQQ